MLAGDLAVWSARGRASRYSIPPKMSLPLDLDLPYDGSPANVRAVRLRLESQLLKANVRVRR